MANAATDATTDADETANVDARAPLPLRRHRSAISGDEASDARAHAGLGEKPVTGAPSPARSPSAAVDVASVDADIDPGVDVNASAATSAASSPRRAPRAPRAARASALASAPGASASHRIAEQPAFVLHSYPYRETSLVIDVLSRDHGRVALVAKGAKRAHSALRGVLQTFQPLSLAWSGKGEVRTLTGAEWVGGMLPLTGDALLCGFYVNELLVKFCAREDACPALFGHYVVTLTRLAHGEPAAQVLRSFERVLLRETGYALTLTRTAARRAVEAHGRYVFDPERGVRDVREFAGHGAARAGGAESSHGSGGAQRAYGAQGSNGAQRSYGSSGAQRPGSLDDGLGRASANPSANLSTDSSTNPSANPSANPPASPPESRPSERFASSGLSALPALPAQWPVLSGQTLLDMEADDYHRAQTLAQSKALMRFLLNVWLDGTPLATRQILIDLQNL